MRRHALFLAGLTLTLALWHCPTATAQAPKPQQPPKSEQPPPPKTPLEVPPLPPLDKYSTTPKILQLLQTEIDVKDFVDPLPLEEALELLSDKLAEKKKGVTLLFDEAAFKAELPPPKAAAFFVKPDKEDMMPGLLETKVSLPFLPKKLSAAQALKVFLSQLDPKVGPKFNATYLIRQGTVVITTAKKASVKSLLQEKVSASFHLKPLFEIVYALSEQTGASIMIDPRVTERMYALLTATFANDTTLQSALNMLTNPVGLRVVVVGEGIYVTDPETAEEMRFLPKY
jgi:hypothetical protein